MNSPDLTSNQHYTVADYTSWNDGQRYELLHGDVHAMTPAPSWQHQVIHAPIDVYLLDDTVVQPDIIVVCDPNKIEKKGCIGAPDLVVEILSPSTAKTDWKDKYTLYEEAGVQEYWIVNPEDSLVHVFRLFDGTFSLDDTYSVEDTVSVGIFEDVVINLKNVFEHGKD